MCSHLHSPFLLWGLYVRGFFLCKCSLITRKSADCTSGTYLRRAAHHGKTQILLCVCVCVCSAVAIYYSCELSVFVITCGLPSLTNHGNKEGDTQKRSLLCTNFSQSVNVKTHRCLAVTQPPVTRASCLSASPAWPVEWS